MHYNEQELTAIKALTAVLMNGDYIPKDARITLAHFIMDSVALTEKVQGLKTYLRLPKFQGDELDEVTCAECGTKTPRFLRKDWVAVGDIFDRL